MEAVFRTITLGDREFKVEEMSPTKMHDLLTQEIVKSDDQSAEDQVADEMIDFYVADLKIPMRELPDYCDASLKDIMNLAPTDIRKLHDFIYKTNLDFFTMPERIKNAIATLSGLEKPLSSTSAG
jgi:hypothetical protein